MSIKCRFYFNPSHQIIDFLPLVGFRRKANRNDGQGRKSKLVIKYIIKQGQHKNEGLEKEMGSREEGKLKVMLFSKAQ
jgi:hypothetical protein